MNVLVNGVRRERKLPAHIAKRARQQLVAAIALVVLAIVYLGPLLFAIVVSFKSPLEVSVSPISLPERPRFENYFTVFSQMNYLRGVLNTLGITIAVAVIVSLIAPLAAYPLARISSNWSRLTYQFFAAGLVIPFFASMIPLYGLMKALGLVNTYFGVVLIYVAGNLPLAIFFYTSFIQSVPRELEEAAALDGCTQIGIFRWIVLPMLRPVTGTLMLFVTLAVWNDFLLPLVFLFKPESRTIMVSVYSFVGERGFDPTLLFPAVILASLPLVIFFLVLSRQIVAGIGAGAVKG
jgi:raffinose/stachyose/melibiose transport system permease protein